MAYLIYAKIQGSAFSVMVDNARDALAKMQEFAATTSDQVEVIAKDLTGKEVDLAVLQSEAEQSS